MIGQRHLPVEHLEAMPGQKYSTTVLMLKCTSTLLPPQLARKTFLDSGHLRNADSNVKQKRIL